MGGFHCFWLLNCCEGLRLDATFFSAEQLLLTGSFIMKAFSSLFGRLILGASSVVTLIALAGCVPVEGQKPKLCDTRVHPYKSERCKMVQTKVQPAKAKSKSKSNY